MHQTQSPDPMTSRIYCRVARLVHPVISQGGAEGAAAFREAADRALAACGMHVAAGGHLHAMICEAVVEHAAQTIEQNGSGSDEAKAAVEGACKAWEQWVTAPVSGAPEAMPQYQEWLQGLPEGLSRPVPDRLAKVLPPTVQFILLQMPTGDMFQSHYLCGYIHPSESCAFRPG